jgi:hypothetical protein
MHVHVFDRFKTTPRLHVKSVLFGEGKSTLFDILEKLVPRPERDDHTTAAILADRANDQPPPTFLIDEADNPDLLRNPTFRAIFNSGFHSKGRRTVMGPKRQRITTRTFAALAIASIGDLPGPMARRSIPIEMRRAPARKRAELIDLDEADERQREMFSNLYAALHRWAWDVRLNPFPRMPDRLQTLPRQLWTPLISVGDACGERVGAILRDAAVAISGHAEDPRQLALEHTYAIFHTPLDELEVPNPKHRTINREGIQLTSETLMRALHDLDALWLAWAGPDGTGKPHPITPGEFARLLRPWRVHPKTIWSAGPKGQRVSAKGWLCADFLALWRDYEVDVSPSHASKIIGLRRHTRRQSGGSD